MTFPQLRYFGDPTLSYQQSLLRSALGCRPCLKLDAAVFQLAADASPNGILVCAEDGTILFANQKIEALFGYRAADLVGRSVDALVPDVDQSAHGTEHQFFWQHATDRAKPTGRGLHRARTARSCRSRLA